MRSNLDIERGGTHPAVALLGLGEAGTAIATDLVALGIPTFGWDPDPARAVAGVRQGPTALGALAGAEIVLSLNSQADAVEAAESVADALGPAILYADLNTTSAIVKRAVAAVVEPTGAAFADVALLAVVPGNGVRTPTFASGLGAARFAAAFRPLGMPVETLGPEPGEAATRKLVRSIFVKGLAAAAVESLEAARRAGCEDWLHGDLAATLAAADGAWLDRLVEGSSRHAVRRIAELESVAALERELGLEPHVAEAALAVLRRLAAALPD